MVKQYSVSGTSGYVGSLVVQSPTVIYSNI